MHISEIYKSIYKYFGDATPLPVDCGALCGKACCESDDDETGMYLFPGEEKLFINNPDFKVIKSDFTYGNKSADIVICKGVCNRDLRPLSCRIFPLIPYYNKSSGLKIISDPRAYTVCPLSQRKATPYLDNNFKHKTEKVFKLLINFSEVRIFLEGLSDILDDYLKFQK